MIAVETTLLAGHSIVKAGGVVFNSIMDDVILVPAGSGSGIPSDRKETCLSDESWNRSENANIFLELEWEEAGERGGEAGSVFMMWMRWLPIDGVGGGGQDNNMLTASIPSIVIRLYLIESSAIITD